MRISDWSSDVCSSDLRNLYGAVTVDQSKNIFEAKQAFASSGRSDGQTASNPVNLIGVTVGNKAAVGKHTIEIIQTAASHRVGSGSFASASTDLDRKSTRLNSSH